MSPQQSPKVTSQAYKITLGACWGVSSTIQKVISCAWEMTFEGMLGCLPTIQIVTLHVQDHFWSMLRCPLHHPQSHLLCMWDNFGAMLRSPYHPQSQSGWKHMSTWTTHLMCSLPPHWKSSCVHSNMEANISPCMHLMCSLSCENYIFHLTWKNSQKNHKATLIPSIRYLCEPPNNILAYLISLISSLYVF